MFRKKITSSVITGVLVIFLSSVGFASGSVAKSAVGFYVGLGLNHLSMNSKFQHIRDSDNIAFFSSNIAYQGVGANVFAGYGNNCGWLHYAFEAALSVIPGHSSGLHLNTFRTGFITTNVSYGLNVKLGKIVKRSVIYGLFGIDNNKFKVRHEVNSPFEFTTWRAGYNVGLGVETPLTDRLSLALQYIQKLFCSFQAHGPQDNFRVKLRPNASVVALNLIYYF